jgi:hypothetical protein
MIPSDAQLRRTTDALVDELLKKGLIELTGDSGTLRDRFFAVLRQNFAEEAALEREAEAFADAHRRELVGMDRSKMVALVKQRLAKERGFVL